MGAVPDQCEAQLQKSRVPKPKHARSRAAQTLRKLCLSLPPSMYLESEKIAIAGNTMTDLARDLRIPCSPRTESSQACVFQIVIRLSKVRTERHIRG